MIGAYTGYQFIADDYTSLDEKIMQAIFDYSKGEHGS